MSASGCLCRKCGVMIQSKFTESAASQREAGWVAIVCHACGGDAAGAQRIARECASRHDRYLQTVSRLSETEREDAELAQDRA